MSEQVAVEERRGAPSASQVVSVAQAKRELSDLCNRAAYGRDTIIVTKRGKPLAAIVSVADLEHYLALEDEHASRMLEQAVATSRAVEKAAPL